MKISLSFYKGTAYHEAGVIYLDADTVIIGDVIHMPFQILFHEAAHAVDFLNSKGDEFFSEHYKAGALFKALKNDFDRLIKNEMPRL